MPNSQVFADQVAFLIGSYKQRFIFLHHNGWIYSAEPCSYGLIRHFFIPTDWLTSNNQLLIEVTCRGDIVFVKRDEVAVVARGLESGEAELTAPNAESPSMSPAKRPLTR